MIFHENCLPADDSHEISCLVIFRKSSKVLNCRLLQIIGGALWVKCVHHAYKIFSQTKKINSKIDDSLFIIK